MPLKALMAGLNYDVKGRVHKTELNQIFEESPWDSLMTQKMLSRGYVEEVVALETSEPVVEVVEEVVEAEEEPDLGSLSKAQLVELAESRGLDSSGTKKTLLARLTSEEEE